MASRYLRRTHGYYIWAKNVRYNCGEIDLIALYERSIVFIEVKTRKELHLNTYAISDAFSSIKLNRLARAKNEFIFYNRLALRRLGICRERTEAVEVIYISSCLIPTCSGIRHYELDRKAFITSR